MNAIQLVNAEIGTVSSRQDGSVKLSVITAELRPSESGLLMSYHGKAAKVTIEPHEDAAPEIIRVTTERDQKTPSSRLRSILFVQWKQLGQAGVFDTFYAVEMEKLINAIKTTLDPV